MTLSNVEKGDDFFKIIRLIYETDDYIYPQMCGGDYVYFEKIMLHHLNTECIFSYKNIVTAKKNGDIMGIILSFTKDQLLPQFPKYGEFEVKECYSATIKDYFQKLVAGVSADCLYINNICVDKKYRGMGVGYALIQYAKKNSVKDKIVLDCLAENLSAIALYEKCGFKIVDRFLGYSGNNAKPISCLKLETQRYY
jgi:hypothetical protein